jgi:hypothetical protein
VRGWLADTLGGKDAVLIVDTNDEAAQVSALVRSQLVQLGRVTEDGVPLADGTLAGVGDLVQARRNAWDLAGYEGNRRGPVNRGTYRLTEIRPDGSVLGDRPDGGGRIGLPSGYVAQHVSLGYASTVHSAQGRTVDSAHALISPRTNSAAAYLALSRGRHGNTAYVSTIQVREDSPPGQASTVERRDPVAVLADVIDRMQDDQSALQLQADSWAARNSARTAADRMADAVELISTGRTAGVLDRLAASGHLTEEERRRLAADPASAQLGRLLRQVELAGQDFELELDGAIAVRPLDGAESIASVIHARMTERLGQLVPKGDSFAERVPAVENPTWRRYLETAAEIADERVRALGTQMAADPPRWAREGLGTRSSGSRGSSAPVSSPRTGR